MSLVHAARVCLVLAWKKTHQVWWYQAKASLTVGSPTDGEAHKWPLGRSSCLVLEGKWVDAGESRCGKSKGRAAESNALCDRILLSASLLQVLSISCQSPELPELLL